MNVFQVFTQYVRTAVETLARAGAVPATLDLSRIVVEPPREASHGDLATNAAMALAKDAGMKPRELAEKIAAELAKLPEVTKTDIAGPGFINLTLDPAVWREALAEAIRAGADYGRGSIGAGQPVNVEYVSANPTGPMHVGHCRGAVFGDALANLLAVAGFAVTREYYINDAGAQVDVLARSAFLRYREALGENIGAIPEGFYPGDYLRPVGEALKAEFGDKLKAMSEAQWLPLVRGKAIAMMMVAIKEDLAALNVQHDVFFSERSLIEGADQVGATIECVARQGSGVRRPPAAAEGRAGRRLRGPRADSVPRDRVRRRRRPAAEEVRRQLHLFRLRHRLSQVEVRPRLPRHDRRVGRRPRRLHQAHEGRGEGGLAATTAELDVKIVQLVKLSRAGVEVKMSKRSGEFVTLREVVDEVGRDAVRFMMLYRKNDAVLDFDIAKVNEQSKDNPVFYVQYGHARGHSIFRNAAEQMPTAGPGSRQNARSISARPSLHRLDDSAELSIMRKIALYPRLVEAAAVAHEPHRVAFYLYELASEFHAQWTRGTNSPHLRFIILDDPLLTVARLALVQGVVTVLASGLKLLGVEAPGEMR